MIEPKRQWTCEGCGRRIDAPLDSNEPTVCEKCGSTALHPAFSGMSIERIVQRVHQEIRTSMLGPQSSVPASWKPGDPLFSSEAGALVSAIAKSEPAPQSQTFTMNGHTDPRLVTYFGPNSDAADSFKELRARIFLSTNGLLRRTILITSPKSSTGVTTVASNLSVAIAQTLDAHALCLEVNYRRPAMLRTFGLDQNRPGLLDFLQSGKELSGFLVRPHPIDRLRLLGVGSPSARAGELLLSARFRDLLRELRSKYDDRYIVIDAASLEAPETFVIARHVDAVVLVARAGKTTRESLVRAAETIGPMRFIGVVLNGVAPVGAPAVAS